MSSLILLDVYLCRVYIVSIVNTIEVTMHNTIVCLIYAVLIIAVAVSITYRKG